MRYMILVKASKDSEAGAMHTEDLLAAIGDYHEQFAKAGCCSTEMGYSPARRAGVCYRLRIELEARLDATVRLK